VSDAAELRADVVVLGAGPGGYTAAFRAADLGRRVVLVERDPTLGGVCLNVGCIPSKALLHLAEVVVEARGLAAHGVEFGPPSFDLARIRAWKDGVVKRLTTGLAGLAKRRGVVVVRGSGSFTGPNALAVEGPDGRREISFAHAIVATGSSPSRLPGFPDDPRILDSTSALQLSRVPERLLVVGGGIIGLEMAAVYHALGSRITVVELQGELLAGADRDLVRPLHEMVESRYEKIRLGTRVGPVEVRSDGLHVALDGGGGASSEGFDAALVAVGRRPNGASIGIERTGIELDAEGFVPVDEARRTKVPHIFAIGDVAGAPMLAHKAMHEGKVAAEVIAGLPASFDALSIPSVAYSDPEVAWTGLTETAAGERGTAVRKAVFPWSASGRALGIDRSEGLTKLLLEPESGRILGAGIVGRNAGELIAELGLAIEMGADAEDVALSIHPHPTLSETVGLAAEVGTGTVTDLPRTRR
jgi:dihydrolipoamide dehydrogenase